jgi:tetratricopeptide (TPR) repeat protein
MPPAPAPQAAAAAAAASASASPPLAILLGVGLPFILSALCLLHSLGLLPHLLRKMGVEAVMGGDNPFSGAAAAHADVMHARPGEEEISKCVEEIKRRARGAFAAKSYREAEALYGKGIELLPGDVTLLSNRSAARLGMGMFDQARSDAQAAIDIDASFAKAHYRLGQALLGLKQSGGALAAFEAGAKLEPENKAWSTMIAKAKEAAAGASAVGLTSPGPSPSPPKPKVLSAPKPAAAAAAATKAMAAGSKTVQEQDDEPGKDMRGYRRTTDGRVTTYFHNELSEQDKNLIGDIAPKRIDAAGVPAPAPMSSNGVSAWNQAGTWEEKNMTGWASQRLRELLSGLSIPVSGGNIETQQLEDKDVNGDASITFSRGKKRLVFEFDIKVKWEAELECGTASGAVCFPEFDLAGAEDAVWESEVTVDSHTPPAARGFVDRYVRSEGEGLRPALQAKLRQFMDDFEAKK